MVDIPARFQKIIDRAKEVDRIYFLQNPDADSYIRDYIKDEFFPYTHPPGTKVLVEQVIEGARLRQALSDQTWIHPKGRRYVKQGLPPREIDSADLIKAKKALSQSDQARR